MDLCHFTIRLSVVKSNGMIAKKAYQAKFPDIFNFEIWYDWTSINDNFTYSYLYGVQLLLLSNKLILTQAYDWYEKNALPQTPTAKSAV